MGAVDTEQFAEGRTIEEAYGNALREATEYYGTQDGYSGAINSKDRGYVQVRLPARMTYRRFSALLNEYIYEVASEIYEATEDVRSYRPGGIWSQMKGAKANLRKAETRLRRARTKRDRILAKYPTLDLDRYADLYESKWGVPLAVELRPTEAKPSKRGRRIYVFFGIAPS